MFKCLYGDYFAELQKLKGHQPSDKRDNPLVTNDKSVH